MFLYAALFIAFIAFFVKRREGCFLFILCTLVFISGALSLVNSSTLSKDDLSSLLQGENQYGYVRGAVKTLPAYKWQRWGNRRCSFLLYISEYKDSGQWYKAGGLSQVTIKDNDREYNYGDSILIYGNIKRLGYLKTKSAGYMKYLHRKGINSFIDVEDDYNIRLVETPGYFSVKRYIYSLRRRIEKRFKKYLPYPDDAISSAMLIGRREHIPKDLAKDFIHTGTMHILSVSGLHTGIISAMIFFILRLFHTPRKLASLIVILSLWFYVVLAGGRAPVVRASIMISMYFLSRMLDRDFDIYSVLAFAGLLILILNPMQAFDAGFQLSFACVFFIVFLTPRIDMIFSKVNKISGKQLQESVFGRFRFYSRRVFLSSLSVFIGVCPIVAFHFKIISPVTIIANMAVIPLLSFLLFSTTLLAFTPETFKLVYLPVSWFVRAMFFILFNVVSFLSSLPFAFFNLDAFPAQLVFLYYFALYIVVKIFSSHNISVQRKGDF